MPGLKIHQTLTGAALESNRISNAGNLAEIYCAYPDFYFDDRNNEVKPYMFFQDGIQFHYPPHTPVEEFYRYWDRNENGNFPFQHHSNENVCHVEAGFRFYTEKVIALLQKGEREEAWKFLGCLLHFLEDSTYGIHPLEGADGTDIFVLDRLFGMDMAKYLCFLDFPEELKTFRVSPKIISDHAGEFVSLLYARYVRDSAISRKLLFDIAVDHCYGTSKKSVNENIREMYLTALQLTADTIATVLAIAEKKVPVFPERELSDFSPFHYPIGGGSGFALRKYEETKNCITFGINSEASILYSIPKNCYHSFTGKICASENANVLLHLINENQSVQVMELENGKEIFIKIPHPGGVFGFRIFSPEVIGKIRITEGKFIR